MTEVFNKISTKEIRRKLRNNRPQPEIILWSKLKNKQLQGFRFRRQFGIGPYIVDFYCPKMRLVIEVDGDSHFLEKKNISYDIHRQKFLESLGLSVLRFTNTDISKNLSGVLMKIIDTARDLPLPLLRKEGEKK